MEDILLAQNGRFVENGDFRIGDSSVQNKFFLLTTPKGVVKNAPLLGAGIRDYILSEGVDVLAKKHEIRRQLTEDGATVRKIEFTGNQLIIDAEY